MPSKGKKTRIGKGDLFESSTNTLGPGKAIDNGPTSDSIVLEYFDTPAQDPKDRHREVVPRVGLRRFLFSAETRVFWALGDGWRSGRVIRDVGERELHVRGHEWEGFLDWRDLYVRWHAPLVDPLGFAGVGLLESPLLADRRRPFLRALLNQRSAARGKGALLSSAVALYEHQIEIARRVLDDPIQRFLLADEVGLGKTIEAGLILRQLLLEDPALEVQLILPPFLHEQWRQELENKFFVGDFPDATLRWARDDDPAAWMPADLVIVDEAHNLARLSQSPDERLSGRYKRLRSVALDSQRLLLLTATPVLHNEDMFLALFHLLDPDVYSRDQVDALRRKVEARADVGRVLLGLGSGVPTVLLRRRVADLLALFPEDDVLAELCGELEEVLQGAAGTTHVEERVREIRIHVHEAYRLNRRMLRTRRTDAVNASYVVTGRRAPEIVGGKFPWAASVGVLIDAWRLELLAASEGDDQAIAASAAALSALVPLASDPVSMRVWIASRLDGQLPEGERVALTRLLRAVETADVEGAISAIADAITYLMNQGERCVVFCSTSWLARAVADGIAELLGADSVVTHLMNDALSDVDDAVSTFEDQANTASVLVCDASAEEGRNFQFADVLVHLGVPSDPNRLEQRIGRLDRWSLGNADWRSYIFGVSDSTPDLPLAWYRVLLEGFGVFERSIASLQHAVERAVLDAWAILLRGGVDTMSTAVDHVSALLEEELQRIREQDALDAIEAFHDERSVFRTLTASEEKEHEFALVADALLATGGPGGDLRFTRVGSPVDGVGSYELTRGGPVPAPFPLIPTWRLARDFLSSNGRSCTFSRSEAVSRDGVRLLRFGGQLIDAVADFLWNDDRGRAWGMWRHAPDSRYPERPWFRFDFHIEASTDKIVAVSRDLGLTLDPSAIARQADGFFPPLVLGVWLDERGRRPDPEIRRLLEAPYATSSNGELGRDYNLNRQRVAWLHQLIPEDVLGRVWVETARNAGDQVLDSDEVRNAAAAASEGARRDLGVRLSQLEIRRARESGAEREQLNTESQFLSAMWGSLIEALAKPVIALDSTGVVVISPDVPEQEAGDT